MKSLAILGSTGSIGRQALEVVRRYPEEFKVAALTANRNLALLARQAREFSPHLAVCADPLVFPASIVLTLASPNPVVVTPRIRSAAPEKAVEPRKRLMMLPSPLFRWWITILVAGQQLVMAPMARWTSSLEFSSPL